MVMQKQNVYLTNQVSKTFGELLPLIKKITFLIQTFRNAILKLLILYILNRKSCMQFKRKITIGHVIILMPILWQFNQLDVNVKLLKSKFCLNVISRTEICKTSQFCLKYISACYNIKQTVSSYKRTHSRIMRHLQWQDSLMQLSFAHIIIKHRTRHRGEHEERAMGNETDSSSESSIM